jgi:hypothetical protein
LNSLQFREVLEGSPEFIALEEERLRRRAEAAASVPRPGPVSGPAAEPLQVLQAALERTAADLAEARRVEADAQFEVARVEDALDRAREALFEAQRVADVVAEIAAEAFLAGESSLGQPSVGNGLDHNPRPSPEHDTALRNGIVTRIEHRLEMAISARDRARAAAVAADVAHKRAALAIVCAEAEGAAAELAQYEAEAARIWSKLSILSGLWLGGAALGPPPLGPLAVAAAQSPPRLAMTDRPPSEQRAMAEAIATGWRQRFAALVEGPEAVRDAAD